VRVPAERNGTQKEAEKKLNAIDYAERYSEYGIRDMWIYR
jgi:hypothetical protein